jgi:S1-C subfamily serine protease
MNSSQHRLVGLAHLAFATLLVSHSHLQASSIPEIVAKTKPAVVEIVAMDEKGTPTTLGTGFFISSDGLVVTNFHVVKDATSLSAVNNNGAIFLFERVVTEPTGVDLAILKFRAKDAPFLQLGKSATAVEGQKVIVIGNPTGLTGSVSDGIISAFREERTMIQITAPISPGSSGSPVMDENGQVIGVATLQLNGQNLNFAIAVEQVSEALGLLLTQKIPPTPYKLSHVSEPPKSYPTSTPHQDASQLYPYTLLTPEQLLHQSLTAPIPNPLSGSPTAVDAEVYFERGLDSSAKHEYANAIADFTEVIWIDGEARAYLNRGNAYFDQGKIEKAIIDYNEAIRIASNIALYYENRARAYRRIGNHAKASADSVTARRLKITH